VSKGSAQSGGVVGVVFEKENVKKNKERDMYDRGNLTNKCSFNRELTSTVYQSSQWRHTVVVVDNFFYFLDNEDMTLFRYPIPTWLISILQLQSKYYWSLFYPLLYCY